MGKNLLTLMLVVSVTVVMTMFVSCGEEAYLAEKATPTEESTNMCNPYRVPLKEALNNAENLLRSLEETHTRNLRSVNNIEYVVNQDLHTRSSNGVDTMLYIVNYGVDDGFAILGADKRLPAVYAIADEGSISLDDISENPGLEMFMDNATNSIRRIPGLFPADSIDWKPIEPIVPDLGDREITYLKKIKPMLSKYASRWGQGAPFNIACVQYPTYKPISVGCAPLACAQIMSYFQWPTFYMGYDLTWQQWNDLYEKYSTEFDGTCPYPLPQFLNKVGETLGVNYNTGNSNVSSEQIKYNFHKFGYEQIGAESALKHSTASTALEKNPILVFGEAASSDTVDHTWVIDGYLSYKEEWNAIADPNHIIFRHMYHCVWGYTGRNNGYFLCSDGGVMGLSPFMYDDIDLGYDVENLYEKKYRNLKFWSNFKPVGR